MYLNYTIEKFVLNLTYFSNGSIHPNFCVNLTQDKYIKK